MGRAVVKLLAAGSLLTGVLLSLPLHSQEIAPAKSNKLDSLPPFPPPAKPPTTLFRQLLSATAAEREQLLADRKPEQREFLLKRVYQYESMPANQRELHLRTLELRWHLLALLDATPSNRVRWLAPLPDADRRLIANRLMYWDLLPSDLQKDVRASELAIRIVVSSDSGCPFLTTPLTNLPPLQRQKIEADIAHWKSLPEQRQQTVYWHFRQLFELTDTRSFAGANSSNSAESLEAFKKRPPSDRELIIKGFLRYTELPPEQREEFMIGVKRWQSMGPQEREKWRQAVNKRPPPSPPLLPPLPHGYMWQTLPSLKMVPAGTASFATNN